MGELHVCVPSMDTAPRVSSSMCAGDCWKPLLPVPLPFAFPLVLRILASCMWDKGWRKGAQFRGWHWNCGLGINWFQGFVSFGV